jgi:hypothetical protein
MTLRCADLIRCARRGPPEGAADRRTAPMSEVHEKMEG